MDKPPQATTNRELLALARRIERYGVQRRKLLARVTELEGSIRECKRLFQQLAASIAGPFITGDDEVLAVRTEPAP